MLKITKTVEPNNLRANFALVGAIDDVTDFTPITSSPEEEIALNFDKVTSVNSYGIKKLQMMMTALKGKRVRYQECRPFLVVQLNMLPSLSKGVKVDSFYLPMECEPCNREYETRITGDEAKQPGFMDRLNDSYPCDKCARKLQFLDDEVLYFRFLGD